MTEILLEAFAVMFVTIGPIDNAAIFAAMTKDTEAAFRRKMAIKSILIASGIMLVFALFGDDILEFFGISLSSLEISGGLLLLIIAVRMVMNESDESSEAQNAAPNQDISIFPLAMPLVAGPDALVAVVMQVSRVKEDLTLEIGVIFLMLLILLMTLIAFLLAGRLSRLLGSGGIEIMSRILGVLLTALAVEFIIEGLSKSILFAQVVGT